MKKTVSQRLVDQHHKQSALSYDDDQQKLFNQQSQKQSNMHTYDYGDRDRFIAKVSVIVYICVFIISLWVNKQWIKYQFSIKVKSIDEYLVDAFMDLDQDLPKKYLQIQNVGEYHAELPFCIVLGYKKIQDVQQIKQSIKRNNYDNYILVQYEISQQVSMDNNKIDTTKTEGKKNKKIQNVNKNDSYNEIINVIKERCPQKSILFFPNQPLSIDSLQKQNAIYQTYYTWLLYSTQINSQIPSKNGRQKIIFEEQIRGIEILSMYRRVFQLVQTNDFDKMNSKLLSRSWHSGYLAASLLQLCKFYSFPVQSKQFYVLNSQVSQKFSLQYNFQNNQQKKKQAHRRIPYQPLHSLNQDYKIWDINELNTNRRLFQQSNYTLTEPIGDIIFLPRDNMVTHQQMQRALQYQQLIYLPEKHSLNYLEIKRMQQVYESGKYSQKQLPLCININSYNNIQNQRYKKVLESVTSQNYTNYKIVFIDDFSTDQTLNKTKQHLQEVLKFPKERVTYVRNNANKKATYNIVNAAFNFCQKDSILLLVDGDDQLIGRQVFKVINAQYQAHDLWTLYTFYKSDKYKEGVSIPFKNQYLSNRIGGRRLIYFFGHLKSFKVSLIRKIPLSQHLDIFGNFFDTLYDAVLQYPIFQLAGGDKHGRYLNEIMYFYSISYGNNDDSNILKATRRLLLHIFITFRSPLKQLSALDDEVQDKAVRNIAQQGKGKQYQIIS